MSTPPTKQSSPAPDAPLPRALTDPEAIAALHQRFGWWTLLVFLSLGLVLEGLHGFKVRAYLDVTNETRRLMWTLAHAHGTLLALIQLGFVAAVRSTPDWPARRRAVASGCLRGAALLMPAGFFLGGVVIHAGDPGLGIVLVPIGGLLLLIGVLLTALAMKRPKTGETSGRRR